MYSTCAGQVLQDSRARVANVGVENKREPLERATKQPVLGICPRFLRPLFLPMFSLSRPLPSNPHLFSSMAALTSTLRQSLIPLSLTFSIVAFLLRVCRLLTLRPLLSLSLSLSLSLVCFKFFLLCLCMAKFFYLKVL